MNEYDDVICQVRESFSGLRMAVPVEHVLARSRAQRRRRATGLTAAGLAAAGLAAAAAATVPTLALGGPGPAHPGHPARPGPVTLAAFSVTSGPGSSTTVIVRKGSQYRLDPGALRDDLARHGIPALVTVGTFCRSTSGAPADIGQILHRVAAADGSDEMVINGSAMPPGTQLSIGEFPNYTRMALIKDGAPLSCGSTSGQPAVHITPTGAPIQG